MTNFTYSDELYHFGIKGMKWGIRRFQNEDGTRTEEGKKRYKSNKLMGFDTRPSNHKTSLFDKSDKRKKQDVEAGKKDADDTIRFYGGKNAAKANVRQEFGYAAAKNTVKAGLGMGASASAIGLGQAMYWGSVGLGEIAGMTLATAGGVAMPVIAIGYTIAQAALAKNASTKIAYINDSDVAQDYTVAKRRD